MTSSPRPHPASPPTTERRPKPTSLLAAAPAIVALCLTMLVEMVDNSILTVALPTIGRDLDVGPTGLQWIIGAYSLTFGGLLLVGGTLGDTIGRRRTLLWGLAGFGLSALLAVFVTQTWQLIALRALCGAFAALIAPLTMSLCFRLFDDPALRRRAIGLIVTVAMIGVIIGPAVGGLAVTHLPWQALLLLNAPAAAIAWLGVWRGFERDDPAELRTGPADVLGGALSVGMLGLGLFSFTLAVDAGWLAPVTLVVATGAVAAAAGFVWRQTHAAEPLLDLRLFGQPTVRGSAILQTASSMAMVAVAFSATQLFQYAWGWSPLQAGLGTLPMVAGMFAAGPLTDLLVERFGQRVAAIIGSLSLLAGLLIVIESLGRGYPLFALGFGLLAGSMRIIMTTCAVALVDALPEQHTSLGSALNDTAQEVGNALGVAVMGTATAAVMGARLPSGAWSITVTLQFLHGQRLGFWILLGVVALVAAFGARTLTDSRSTEEPHEQAEPQPTPVE